MKHAHCVLACLAVGVLLLASLPAHAGPYQTQPNLVVAQPGPQVPGPATVPGKEYSEDLTPFTHNPGDKDALGNAVPEQVIAWDGTGGVANSFNYSFSRQGDTLQQVDALANNQDMLYDAVIKNRSALLFSVDDEGRPAGALPPFSSPNIFYEPIGGPPAVAPPAPGGPIWATPAQIDQHGVTDVDGLEIWGPEPTADSGAPIVGDANRYSLYGDPGIAGAGRVSVWAYNPPPVHVSTPYVWAGQLAGAIAPNDPELPYLIDLDALMVYDLENDDYFGPGDSILFSIAPVNTGITAFDGGEVWVWTNGAPAAFLNHGGHLWNTPFNVMASFGVDSENVNALEAVSVPEPGTLVLLGLGGMALGGWALARRRRTA